MPNVKDWPAKEIVDQVEIIRIKNPTTGRGDYKTKHLSFN